MMTTPAAQTLLEIWETLGESRLASLRRIRKELTSLDSVTGESEVSDKTTETP